MSDCKLCGEKDANMANEHVCTYCRGFRRNEFGHCQIKHVDGCVGFTTKKKSYTFLASPNAEIWVCEVCENDSRIKFQELEKEPEKKDRFQREESELEQKIMDTLYSLTTNEDVEFNRGLREARVAIRKIFDVEAGYEIKENERDNA